MKKIIFTLILIIATYSFIGEIFATNYIIPEESIRLRVLANSDLEYDQKIKQKVFNLVQQDISNLLTTKNNYMDAKKIISNNLDYINNHVKELLIKEKYMLDYDISFGQNYFPKKTYKGVEYKEGYYESLVITLGKGEGHNWWCVLFPPLCLIEANDDNTNEVEYKSLIKEMIDKYL
ncbi:MAG: stage II sporulation protein R [Bacilli bacterium]|nr:stage II sporulation protein R [Bacilli bacterium]